MTKAFDYMFSKKSLPVIALLLCAGLVVGFKSLGLGGGTPPTKYEKILHNIGDMLSQNHYSPKKINDEFSREIFKKYLSEKIDVQKNIFFQSDIQQLKKYENKLDDEIKGGAVEFVPAVSELFKKRVLETELLYKEWLTKPFDFNKDETVNLNYEKLDYPKNEAERKEAWRKRIKYAVLERYASLLEEREKNTGKEGFVSKTDAELEKDARDRVLKSMDKLYDRLKFKFDA